MKKKFQEIKFLGVAELGIDNLFLTLSKRLAEMLTYNLF